MSHRQVASICKSAPFHDMASTTNNNECLLQEHGLTEGMWLEAGTALMLYSRISVAAIRSHK